MPDPEDLIGSEAAPEFSYDALVTPPPEEWLRLDPQEQAAAVEQSHRRSRARHAPVPNAQLHALAHTIVETQLAQDDPPEARSTLERLIREGADRHGAIHAIASVVMEFVWEASQPGGGPFDRELNAKRLAALRGTDWRPGPERSPVRRGAQRRRRR